jgi:hypothetical protein
MRGVILLVALAVAVPAAAASGPPPSNQIVLTRKQSERLVSYAGAIRACLVRTGVDAARPRVTRRQISLAVSGESSRREVVRAGLACAGRVGDPPSSASLQAWADRIVLYVPKQCLIDPNVVRGAGQAGLRSG